ncbi:MAG: nuclease-related domain-containing protein [Nocardioidaceae bacterium]
MSIEEGTRGESGLDSAAVPGTSQQAQPTADMASLPGARIGTPVGTTSVLEGLSSEWKVLHARHWPGRPFDTIDHVAIGPNGVFIVDGVGWRGEVVVTPDALEVNGRIRTAAVHNTQEMAREVALLLPPHLRDHCYPVICLTREEPISGWVKAVRVCTTVTLAHLIETRDPVLTTAEVASIAVELDGALPVVHTNADHNRATDAYGGSPPQQRKPSSAPRPPWYRTWTGRLVAGGVGVAAIAIAAVLGMHAAGKDVSLNDGARPSPAFQHGVGPTAG